MNKRKNARKTNKTDVVMIVILGLVAAAVFAAVWLAPRFLRDKNSGDGAADAQVAGESQGSADSGGADTAAADTADPDAVSAWDAEVAAEWNAIKNREMSEAQKAASELSSGSKYSEEELKTLEQEALEQSFGREVPPESEEPSEEEAAAQPLTGADAILGRWESESGSITVVSWVDAKGVIHVEMDREDDGANAVEFWACTVSYEKKNDRFVYSDCTKSETGYDAEENESKTIYEEGTGSFAVRQNYLYWTDGHSDIPADLAFIRQGDY